MSDLDKPCEIPDERLRVQMETQELITGAEQYDLTQYDTKASDEFVRTALSFRQLSREATEQWLNRKSRA